MHTVCSFFNFYLSFLILGIRKLLTAVDDLIVIRFALCAFMVLAFFTDFLIIWLDLELIRDIWFIAKHTINARRDLSSEVSDEDEYYFNSHASSGMRSLTRAWLFRRRKNWTPWRDSSSLLHKAIAELLLMKIIMLSVCIFFTRITWDAAAIYAMQAMP